jgi:hypothetical protein
VSHCWPSSRWHSMVVMSEEYLLAPEPLYEQAKAHPLVAAA